MSKPKESLIDLNIKSDIQHPFYLKQITVARWNPKTPVGGSGVKGCVKPSTQKPILNRECDPQHYVDLGSRHYKYADVSSHILVNLVTEGKSK